MASLIPSANQVTGAVMTSFTLSLVRCGNRLFHRFLRHRLSAELPLSGGDLPWFEQADSSFNSSSDSFPLIGVL
jgi:hypothetical protein